MGKYVLGTTTGGRVVLTVGHGVGLGGHVGAGVDVCAHVGLGVGVCAHVGL